MNGKSITMDDVILANVYANVLAITLMDDELINVSNANVINESIATSSKFSNSSAIISKF